MAIFGELVKGDAAVSLICAFVCAVASFFFKDRPRLKASALGLFAGYLITLAVTGMIPQSLRRVGVMPAVLGCFSGIIISMLVCRRGEKSVLPAGEAPFASVLFASSVCGVLYGMELSSGSVSLPPCAGISGAVLFKILRLSALSAAMPEGLRGKLAFPVLSAALIPDFFGILICSVSGILPAAVDGMIRCFLAGTLLYSSVGCVFADAVRMYYGNITVMAVIAGVLAALVL